ncbi:MAG: hypothetical protein JNJ62_09360 [Pseudoxanthomonas mexicana]|nr:hypothetical protein [Pseudoxanthomonas mexicana]
MTIRAYLRTRKARYSIVGTIGLVLAMGLGMAGSIIGDARYSYATLVLLPIVLVCTLFSRSLRCPRCKGDVGSYTSLIRLRGAPLVRRVDFCAYCGVSLDEPIVPKES